MVRVTIQAKVQLRRFHQSVLTSKEHINLIVLDMKQVYYPNIYATLRHLAPFYSLLHPLVYTQLPFWVFIGSAQDQRMLCMLDLHLVRLPLQAFYTELEPV